MEIPFLDSNKSEPPSSSPENVSTSSMMEARSDEDSTCQVFALEETKKQLDLLQKFIDFDMEQLKKAANDPIPSNPAKFQAYMKNFGYAYAKLIVLKWCPLFPLSHG